MTLLRRLAIWLLLVFALLLMGYYCRGADITYPKQRTQRELNIENDDIGYLMVTTYSGKVITTYSGEITRMSIHPFGTSQLQEHTMDFCDDVKYKFRDKGMFVVLTYDKIMHRKYCYDLFFVHSAIEYSTPSEVRLP